MVESAQYGSKDKRVAVTEIQFSRTLSACASQTAMRTGRRSMNRFWSALSLVILCAALAHGAVDATITGVVKDSAGAPFRGAFVHAQNVQSKISVDVMSDSQGRYRIPDLPPGTYKIHATAI